MTLYVFIHYIVLPVSLAESMETESSYSTNSTTYYTSLTSTSGSSPTHSSSSISMAASTMAMETGAPISTMEMDIGGIGNAVMLLPTNPPSSGNGVVSSSRAPRSPQVATPTVISSIGKGEAGLIVGENVKKEMTTQQLSIAVDDKDRKITELEEQLARIRKDKSHAGDAERIKELEDLLRKKVDEITTQMEETAKLREALTSRADAPVYKMTSKPHGLAVIFVNAKFDANPQAPNLFLNDRAGAQMDEQHFTSIFKFLGYTIVVYRNQKSAEMHAKMEELSKLDHSKYDSLVICVSSHGNQRAIYGSDSVEVKRDEFCDSIKSCPSLKGKPKLFFIQACRLPVVDADSNRDGKEGEATPMTTPLHPDADMLIANAATPDNAAYISSFHGSWFVASLQRKLTDAELIHSRTLSQLLVEVNGEVCQQQGRTRNEDETVNQCVEVITRLRKGVTFFQK